MNNPADMISQREKREVFRNDRLIREAEERRRRTYSGHALDGEPELSGRFAKVSTTTVTGSSPVSYPAQPEGSPWRSDPIGPEPPLGFSVEDKEPVGEKHEVEASTADGTSAVEENPVAQECEPAATGLKFRRRF
jgi:hypothetical protein